MRWRFLILAALLAGCSLAPDYHRPAVPAPPAFKEAEGWLPAAPKDATPRGDWWEIFNDAGLNALETKLGAANPDLRAAVARYDEARAVARSARADYFPAVGASLGVTRQKASQSLVTSSPPGTFNEYALSGDFSYEIDLWGRIRNAVKSEEALAEASDADRANVELSLRAELAIDYFALEADDAEQAVLDAAVAAYDKALVLTRNRFEGGIVSETDVDQAEAQYQNARTQSAEMRLKRAQLEHAIAVLVGDAPATFTLPPKTLTAAVPPVTPGLPATLLERRPDVAAAERRAMAANARIGVARAAWYPDISLAGSLGFESAAASTLFTAPSRFWTLGPSIAAPLFEGGRIEALNDQARAAYDEAASNYRSTVLAAYKDAEDALVALHRLAEESESQAAASSAADRAQARAQNRYEGGIATYLDVVVAQNIALQARIASVDVLTRRLTASVQLVKALGGGWQGIAPPKQ